MGREARYPRAPKGRRDEFVEPYFKGAKPDGAVAVLKACEPARIMIAIGEKATSRWHLQFAERWVVQYNFYINDQHWGRMFVRMCPYLPFSARVCLNQHHWLANRMRQEGIDFEQCSNAFMRCAKPERLQELADELRPRDLAACGQKWLACFTPFFTPPNENRPAASIGCSSLIRSSATTSCSIAAPRSTSSASGSSTPIGPSDSQTRSRRYLADGSANSIAASCRPKSSTWIWRTR